MQTYFLILTFFLLVFPYRFQGHLQSPSLLEAAYTLLPPKLSACQGPLKCSVRTSILLL